MTLLDEIEAAIPALRRYAVALVGDRDRADDLVQDCLERALSRRHLWRGDGPVRAWMFRILLNLARDRFRRAARMHVVGADDLAAPTFAGGQEAHLELGAVQAAMARLPDDQRAALLLVALEGLSLADAARALGVPQGTLVSRLGRARAALRAMTGRETIAPKRKDMPG